MARPDPESSVAEVASFEAEVRRGESQPSRVGRTLLLAVFVSLGVATAAIVLWDRFAPAALELVYHDPRFGPLHEAIQAHARVAPDHRDPAYYVRNGRTVLTRALITAAGIEILVWALVFRRETVAMARAFFGAAAPPTSLAIFRVVLFSVLLIKVATTDTAYYSELPDALRMPPYGTNWLSGVVPINATVTRAVRAAFYVVCTAAILGLFTRTAAALALLLGAYALGVPQIFGSMNADHHLLWFAAILAVSPCGDVLSLDAVRAAWRDADRGVLEPPAPARQYALPLRFVWLLLGVIYFFPGFWKIWHTGLEWVTAENLRLHMLLKWTEFHDWTPIFRADAYPLLLFLGALGTVVFELSFIFCVFTPRGRLLAAAGGLAFHNACWVLLDISFWLLQLMYVALIDWTAVFRRAGRALFPHEMFVVYDGNCRLCRRTIATLRRFDLLERITWLNGLDHSAMAAHGLSWLDPAAVAADLHAVVGGRARKGFAAYRALAPRLPALWLLWPLLLFRGLGTRIYRRTADHRACAVPLAQPMARARRNWALVPMTVVGVALLAGNIGFGVAWKHMAWPLFCFPTFAWIAAPSASRLGVEVTQADGRTVPVDVRQLNGRYERRFTPERLQGLIIAIFDDPPERRDNRLRALWSVLVRGTDDFAHAKSVRFYRDTITTDPERRHEPPLARQLIYEMPLAT